MKKDRLRNVGMRKEDFWMELTVEHRAQEPISLMSLARLETCGDSIALPIFILTELINPKEKKKLLEPYSKYIALVIHIIKR